MPTTLPPPRKHAPRTALPRLGKDFGGTLVASPAREPASIAPPVALETHDAPLKTAVQAQRARSVSQDAPVSSANAGSLSPVLSVRSHASSHSAHRAERDDVYPLQGRLGHAAGVSTEVTSRFISLRPNQSPPRILPSSYSRKAKSAAPPTNVRVHTGVVSLTTLLGAKRGGDRVALNQGVLPRSSKTRKEDAAALLNQPGALLFEPAQSLKRARSQTPKSQVKVPKLAPRSPTKAASTTDDERQSKSSSPERRRRLRSSFPPEQTREFLAHTRARRLATLKEWRHQLLETVAALRGIPSSNEDDIRRFIRQYDSERNGSRGQELLKLDRDIEELEQQSADLAGKPRAATPQGSPRRELKEPLASPRSSPGRGSTTASASRVEASPITAVDISRLECVVFVTGDAAAELAAANLFPSFVNPVLERVPSATLAKRLGASALGPDAKSASSPSGAAAKAYFSGNHRRILVLAVDPRGTLPELMRVLSLAHSSRRAADASSFQTWLAVGLSAEDAWLQVNKRRFSHDSDDTEASLLSLSREFCFSLVKSAEERGVSPEAFVVLASLLTSCLPRLVFYSAAGSETSASARDTLRLESDMRRFATKAVLRISPAALAADDPSSFSSGPQFHRLPLTGYAEEARRVASEPSALEATKLALLSRAARLSPPIVAAPPRSAGSPGKKKPLETISPRDSPVFQAFANKYPITDPLTWSASTHDSASPDPPKSASRRQTWDGGLGSPPHATADAKELERGAFDEDAVSPRSRERGYATLDDEEDAHEDLRAADPGSSPQKSSPLVQSSDDEDESWTQPREVAEEAAAAPPPPQPDAPREPSSPWMDWTVHNAQYVSDVLRLAMVKGPLEPCRANEDTVIPVQIYLQLEERLEPVESMQIHRKLLFDAVNETLLELYPCLRGAAQAEETPIWQEDDLSHVVKSMRRPSSDLLVLQKEVQERMLRFDMEDGATEISPGKFFWKTTVADRSHRVVEKDIRETEKEWLDCPEDRAECAFSLADAIFEDLLAELVIELDRVEELKATTKSSSEQR